MEEQTTSTRRKPWNGMLCEEAIEGWASRVGHQLAHARKGTRPQGKKHAMTAQQAEEQETLPSSCLRK